MAVTCVDFQKVLRGQKRLAPLAKRSTVASHYDLRCFYTLNTIRGTQREYSSKPLKHSIVKRVLEFKRWIWAYFYPL